jgi:hypothetical protein
MGEIIGIKMTHSRKQNTSDTKNPDNFLMDSYKKLSGALQPGEREIS